MSLAGLLVRTVTRLRAPVTVDSHGNEVRNWSTATSVTMNGWLAQRIRDENNDNRDARISDWHLTVPTGSDITALDRVVIDGQTFELDGPPNTAWTPRGPHHIECSLRVVEG